MKKILLIEDDINLAFIIIEELKVEGFNIIHLINGDNALSIINDFKPNIVLLDVNLQTTLNGFEIARRIRFQSNIPILFTTSRTLSEDLKTGFSIGNVDYLKKPFGICELVLRINELLSRNTKQSEPAKQFQIGKFIFNPFEKILLYNDSKKITLKMNESSVLYLLCTNIHNVVTKDEILKTVWDDFELRQKEASLYNIISALRDKLSDDNSIIIKTYTKTGWKLTQLTID
ncbi:MAG: response regulator transcription factor [Paludibacter sp.]|nr:response regulator transcription factor [Paludibacter sp.]